MAARLQRLQHDVVGAPDEYARQRHIAHGRYAGEKLAVVAHRIVGGQAVFLTDKIVVQSVCRGGMHQPCTGICRDMLAANQRHDAILEWVLQGQHIQCRTFAYPHGFAAELIAFKASVR